ncbi:MAG: phosphate signaling complex protein PhoU [Hydrogenobacter thermophilus]|jgi:phosphate transport system protein|uniref:Phosphate-specific transport system accessory protein PhoU n=1 Tax=Hydrogenobacter thermophilus (strain DSM 6534 / IAM 12695 / TK-6) TaxID=608538 RepID=D3DGI1_HYDTT|nr:phosphate signaling complex protein PhoU [Hydrogenobacter thermophilus]ADO44868.1 phosphate uptake regulator, PhoU [Hydrogenobacter thermophilus TK-6]QWK20095.1 MAG: phosphate signaling complex protein PhoU [Hydrogenobacter thermophilus]BAI68933.1 phosphate uptake regulator [Hydrogenobacter thermophilus TK-6]
MKLFEELEETKQLVLKMAGLIKNAVEKAIESLNKQDIELAESIIKGDDEIDQLEVEIERRCIRMIALYQPEAIDLRLIMGIYKVVSDLERIGDEAENIAERAILLAQEPPLKPYVNLTLMAGHVKDMIEDAVMSFFQRDTELAKKVIARDDTVDELYHQLERELITYVMEDPRNIKKVINLSFVGRHFERMADHAENIAEMAVYWSEGEVIKHQHIKEKGMV